jgi:formamidopyrimidine-DNA glycosylase
MATIAVPRLVRVATQRTHARPRLGLRDTVDLFVYGRTAVDCEECGTSLRPNRAIWRGAHPYCSVEHEAADSF